MSESVDSKISIIHFDICDCEPCLFVDFERKFISTESWSVECDNITSALEVDSNINRPLHKNLYHNFAIWNHTMTHPPTKHPARVAWKIKEMFPSKCFMGYKRKRNEEDNRAITIDGDRIEGRKWVQSSTGKYEINSIDLVFTYDMGWQKKGPKDFKK